MSEDVNIVGATFGADVPEWANELTLKKVLAQMEKSFSLSEKQADAMRHLLDCCRSGGKITNADHKQNRQLFDEVRRQGNEQRQLNLRGGAGSLNLGGRGAGATRIGRDMFSSMSSGLSAFGGELSGLTGELGLASTGVNKFGSFLKSVWSGPGAGFMSGMGLIGSLLGKVIGDVKRLAGTLKGLADYGIRIEGGMVEFSRAMAATGMTMEQLTAMSEKYSNVMVSKGVTGIVNLANEVGALSGGISKFGLTTAEATEYTAEYLEQQRLVGVFARRSQMDQTRAIQENISRLTAYSKILGISRKQMEESAKQMLGRDDLQRMFFTMAPEEREKALDSFKSISDSFTSLGEPGKKMLEMFTDMAASPIPQASESFRMLAQVSPEMAMQFADMTDRMKRGEKVSQEEIIAVGKQLGAQKQLLAAFALAGGEVAQLANTLGTFGLTAEQAEQRIGEERVKAAEKYGTSVAKLTDAQFKEYLDSVGGAAEGAAKVEDAMNRFKATLEYAGIKAFTDLLGGDGKEAVDKMVNGLNTLTAKILEFSDNTTLFSDFGNLIRNLTGTDGLAGLAAVLATVVGGFGLFGAGLGAAGSLLLGGPAAWVAAIGGVAGAYTGGKWYDWVSDKSVGLAISDGVGKLTDTIRSKMGNEEAAERIRLNKEVRNEYASDPSRSILPDDTTKTNKVKTKEKAEAATPKTPAPPKVKKPDAPKTKTTEDLIQELISKGDGEEIDLLTDIRQLMAESVRKLERVESAIKSNGDAM